MPRPRTRRAFLAETGRFGLAAGLAVVGQGRRLLSGTRAHAQPTPASVEVLIQDVRHDHGAITAYSVQGDAPAWLISPVFEAAFPFTHVGMHWRGVAPSRIELRTSGDGLGWSSWQRLKVDGSPEDNPRGEWFTALIRANRDVLAQYRLPAAGPVPEQVTLTYLNSLDGPRRPVSQITAPSQPIKGADLRSAIITREEWGADESIRFAEDGEELWERAYVAPRIVVIHHTATCNFPPDPAAEVRAIYAFHTITRGWGDIGYHALVDADGQIYEGRRGRDVDPFGRLPRDVFSFGVVGAHASGYNHGSVGIALLGDFQELAPTAAAWDALEEILVFAHRRYEIDPRTALDYARTTDMWRYDLPTLSGHRDCGITECPGELVYRQLPVLRERVAERINGGAPSTRAIVDAPPCRNIWPGTASFEWQGAKPYDVVFEGFWKQPEADPVDYLLGYDQLKLAAHATTTRTEASFELDVPGQYTLHVRPAGQAFADRVTVLVERQVVRDNADAEGVHRTEGWTRSQSVVQFYGSDYEVAHGGSGAQLTWDLPVPESGRYRVEVCWPGASDHTPAAPYTVACDGDVLANVRLDQTQRGGLWATLGTFDLIEGQVCQVTLTAPDDAHCLVVADAARIVLDP